MFIPFRRLRSTPQGLALAALVWILAWALMTELDGWVDLANLSMLLVLAAAVAALWLPVAASMASSLASVLIFNWAFVPPRHSLHVDMQQHALLLGAMLSLSWITAVLMARLRAQAEQAHGHARQAEQLRRFADVLRDADEPDQQTQVLVDALQPLSVGPVLLLWLKDRLPPRNNADDAHLIGGSANADQNEGLWACMRGGQPFGPGTGRHEELSAWYLPLRGRRKSLGAALLTLDTGLPADPKARAQAQALCDLLGQALERLATERAERRAHDAAEGQATRNALLAAISHDYRTPLATIMSAASSLQEQDARLTPAQRERLATTIIDETKDLARFTDNTLQLARLDGPASAAAAAGVALQLDWESAEDIIGVVMGRVRRRHAAWGRRVHARLEPGLPLLRCDALLLAQALENLVDNALKYAPDGPIELLAREHERHLVVSVRDRGPGVAPGWRERIFEVFQRGAEQLRGAADGAPTRGAGVGLAACRAIARAHGGEMRYRARSHGGASFECWLPLGEAPHDAPAPEPEEKRAS